VGRNRKIDQQITNTADYEELSIIGSGGNINKIFKMSGKAQEMPFPIYVNLSMLFKSHHIRTKDFRSRLLNPDRADVIIPAIRIS
jgi:exopolyphosphatase/guanosine-5'-triphosphate,3'-diphosphate pyrophosphatase